MPLTYEMPDGTFITIEEESDRAELRAWYADHPDSREAPVLQYPYTVVFVDGSEMTIVTQNSEKTTQ